MSEMDARAWAKELAEQRAWVMQIPNRIIGRVKRVGEVKDVLGGTCVTLEFEEGHTFHANPDNFVRLTDGEVAAYQDMVNNVRMVVGLLARRAADVGMQQPTFEVLCGAALSAQLAAFKRRHALVLEQAPDDV